MPYLSRDILRRTSTNNAAAKSGSTSHTSIQVTQRSHQHPHFTHTSHTAVSHATDTTSSQRTERRLPPAPAPMLLPAKPQASAATPSPRRQHPPALTSPRRHHSAALSAPSSRDGRKPCASGERRATAGKRKHTPLGDGGPPQKLRSLRKLSWASAGEGPRESADTVVELWSSMSCATVICVLLVGGGVTPRSCSTSSHFFIALHRTTPLGTASSRRTRTRTHG